MLVHLRCHFILSVCGCALSLNTEECCQAVRYAEHTVSSTVCGDGCCKPSNHGGQMQCGSSWPMPVRGKKGLKRRPCCLEKGLVWGQHRRCSSQGNISNAFYIISRSSSADQAFLLYRCLARPSVWSPLLPPWGWGGLYITWSIFTLLPPAEHYDASKQEPQFGPTCLLPTPEEFMCCLHPLWWDWCRCHLWCRRR